MNIIGHRKIFYAVSALLFAASIGALLLWGLKLGIDFTGGSLLEIEFTSARPPVAELADRIGPVGLGAVRLQPTGERGLFVRSRHMSEPEHQAVLTAFGIADGGVRELRFDTVGPTVGRELAKKSLLAILLVILLIVSYIAFAFRRVSAPIASWKYGIATVVALIHDVVIPAGVFAAVGRLAGFEVDTLFVTALLTILGFSVHDTIVVFDRIRENLKKASSRADFADIVNASVRQTLVRSLNTSLTVALALAAVYAFGGATTRVFSLTLLVGIAVGTYSSIFIASPLLVSWHNLMQRKGNDVRGSILRR